MRVDTSAASRWLRVSFPEQSTPTGRARRGATPNDRSSCRTVVQLWNCMSPHWNEWCLNAAPRKIPLTGERDREGGKWAAHSMLTPMFDALAHLSGPAWTLWRLPQPGGFALTAAAFGVIWALAPRGWPLRFAAPLTWLPLALPISQAPLNGAFRVTALDIGQGSSIVIETTHHTLLFDAGPGPESTHAGERIVVPYLFAHGLSTLDTLMISHS